jgi:hypothetical protein
MDMFFSAYLTVAEGFPFKTWRGAPQAGRTKVPPTAKGLLQRGCSIDQRSIKIEGDLWVIGKFVYPLLREVMVAPQPGRGVAFPRISGQEPFNEDVTSRSGRGCRCDLRDPRARSNPEHR